MKTNVLSIYLVIALCIVSIRASGATVLVSAFGDGSASRANALAAYNSAAPGDTIQFPLNGSATWTTALVISKPVILNGNGTTLTAAAAGADGLFYITGFSSTAPVRVTGFTFNLVNFNTREAAVKVLDNISLENLRIDNNTFHFGYAQIEVGGSKGVIDHNDFINPLKGISFTAGSVLQANASWASMAAGTSEAIFIEDNDFIYDANYPGTFTQESIGTYNGGKLVVRYNRWDASAIPINRTIDPVMTHGSAAGGVTSGYWQIGTGGRRGQSVVEIYNNQISGKRFDFLCVLRGSANLVHDNVLDTQANTPRVSLYEEEQYETSNWNPLRTAWPAEDQVHNSFFWNNTLRLNGVANPNYVEVSTESTNFIQLNRDYFLHAPQNVGGKEVFIGANGASGSFPTDGIKHPTNGTMIFDASLPNAYFGYVPFTYPHPLIAGTPQVQTPPSNAVIQIQVTP